MATTNPLTLLRELLAEDRQVHGPELGLVFDDVFEEDARLACGQGTSWYEAAIDTREAWRAAYEGSRGPGKGLVPELLYGIAEGRRGADD